MENLLGALGLVGLTAVTSWVVASISVWLVPVYVVAMILIFAAPRTKRPKPVESNERQGKGRLGPDPHDEIQPRDASEERAVEPGEPSPGEDPLASSTALTDPPAPDVEAAGATSPKPRKRRVKAKKSAKAGAVGEDASTTAQVTWVRVGPGKFVRSVALDPEAEGSPQPPVSAADAEADAFTQSASDSSSAPSPEADFDASPVADPIAGTVAAEVEVDDDAGAGDLDGSPVSVLVVESSASSTESPSADPGSAPDFGPGEDAYQDLQMEEDETPRFDEALMEPGSIDLPEAVEVVDFEEALMEPGSIDLPEAADVMDFDEALMEPGSIELPEAADVVDVEVGNDFDVADVSEVIAEEHGIAPSTLGEGLETVFDPEAGRDQDPQPVSALSRVIEPIAEAEVHATPVAWAAPSMDETRVPERTPLVGLTHSPTTETAKRASAGLAPSLAASLRQPRGTVVEPRVGPSPQRLRNVRRSVARRRPALVGRAAETRVRQRSGRIRSRLVNVKRDFQPRSPPTRA